MTYLSLEFKLPTLNLYTRHNDMSILMNLHVQPTEKSQNPM